MTRAAALILPALLVACAPGPDAIAPAPLAPDTYAGIPCADARARHRAATETLAALEARQRSAATGDALAVLLIGLPVSGLTGSDARGLIATEKGRLLALDARLARC